MNTKYAEYAVETYYDGKFNSQIDVYRNYDIAYEVAMEYKKDLDDGEEVHITTIIYDENWNEIDMFSEAI